MMKRLSLQVSENLPASYRTLLLFTALAISMQLGCNNMIRRGQSPDQQLLKFNDAPVDTKYVANVCNFWGLRTKTVEGVGLATGLDGTGSSPVPSGQLEFLKRNLESDDGVADISAAVKSKNTSIVLIKGNLPPGSKKGDRFDLEIGVMVTPKTETSSLEYGELRPTELQPLKLLGRSVKHGKVSAMAEGRVLVDSLFETRKDAPDQLHGIIPGGGICKEDLPVGLTVKTKETAVRVTRAIAHSINRRFTTVNDNGREGAAKPTTDRIVRLQVPDAYKHNIGRFANVVMLMTVEESAQERVARLDQLDRKIADPTNAARAALELEGIGEEAIPTLRRALQHHDPEVKFYVAQALAYMDEADGVDVLKAAALNEPAFRWHALTALASIEQSPARAALEELTDVESAETRYGAFRALMARSPEDPLIRGRWLSDDFYFHVIPGTAKPMLHISRSKRPEIVLFGANQTVADNFLHVESGLTVQGIGEDRVRVTRYIPSRGEFSKTCSTEIRDLIETLSDVGVDYTTFINMFRSAAKNKTLNTRFVVNAVPEIGRKLKMDHAGSIPAERSERYVAEPMTTLFSDGSQTSEQPSVVDSGDESGSGNSTDQESQPISLEAPRGVLHKMKGIFGGG